MDSNSDLLHPKPDSLLRPVVEAQDLTKFYGNQRAVDGIAFDVKRGETFGLLGPNGAG